MADNIIKLLSMNHYELHEIARKSAVWFENEAFHLGQAELTTPKNVLRHATSTRPAATAIQPGGMYMFLYDAKHKETLPYFDMLPLVLPFSPTKDGFVGLNLHYLPTAYRIKLLSRLAEFRNSKTLDEKTKMQFSWATINSVAKYKEAIPCVKRYLTMQMRTSFREIKAPDWATAAMLPLERFSGSSKFQVWVDSISRIQ